MLAAGILMFLMLVVDPRHVGLPPPRHSTVSISILCLILYCRQLHLAHTMQGELYVAYFRDDDLTHNLDYRSHNIVYVYVIYSCYSSNVL